MNLVTNAAEALGDEGGRVSVCTGRERLSGEALSNMQSSTDAEEGDYVYIEVSDDGPGMDPVTRARLFEPFYSTKFSGRGLGLAVVLGIVRAHRGAIQLTSQLGEGTSIRVFLPMLEAAPDAVASSVPVASVVNELGRGADPKDAPRVVDGPASGMVLVIDDEEPVSELAQIFLERAGFEVLVAGGGREGLELFEKNSDRVVLVLLDLTMPEVSGGEVFAELRKVNPSIPVVVTSGYTHETAARRIGTMDRTRFVQKPYEPDVLLVAVNDLLAPSAGSVT
jgi:CheY-like chemotaxis protein